MWGCLRLLNITCAVEIQLIKKVVKVCIRSDIYTVLCATKSSGQPQSNQQYNTKVAAPVKTEKKKILLQNFSLTKIITFYSLVATRNLVYWNVGMYMLYSSDLLFRELRLSVRIISNFKVAKCWSVSDEAYPHGDSKVSLARVNTPWGWLVRKFRRPESLLNSFHLLTTIAGHLA